MSDFKYQITKHIGEISRSDDGRYTKEVNLIRFSGGAEKIDIRKWDKERDRMGKGIAVDFSELETLKQLLGTI